MSLCRNARSSIVLALDAICRTSTSQFKIPFNCPENRAQNHTNIWSDMACLSTPFPASYTVPIALVLDSLCHAAFAIPVPREDCFTTYEGPHLRPMSTWFAWSWSASRKVAPIPLLMSACTWSWIRDLSGEITTVTCTEGTHIIVSLRSTRIAHSTRHTDLHFRPRMTAGS